MKPIPNLRFSINYQIAQSLNYDNSFMLSNIWEHLENESQILINSYSKCLT